MPNRSFIVCSFFFRVASHAFDKSGNVATFFVLDLIPAVMWLREAELYLSVPPPPVWRKERSFTFS
jgi:hypothetical protein